MPPRGSGGRGGRIIDDQRGNASSSSSTSGRGDANRAYKLHEPTRTVTPLAENHHASGVPPRTVRTPLHANLSHFQRPNRPEQPRIVTVDGKLRDPHANFFSFRENHVVAGKANVPGELLLIPPRTYQENLQRYRYDEEDDEFVSVEKYEDNYIIRTSTYPFRPERGRYRFEKSPVEKCSTIPNQTSVQVVKSPNATRSRAERHAETMNKFTYFINPGGASHNKMSRKDKKHSDTYAERIRRQQEESLLHTSSADMKLGVIRNNPQIFIHPASFITPVMREKKVNDETKIKETTMKIIWSPETKDKKMTPRPSFRKQIFAAPPKINRNFLYRSEKSASIRKINQAIPDYLRHAEKNRVISNINDGDIVERKEITGELYRESLVRQALSDSTLKSLRKRERSDWRDSKNSVRRASSMKVLSPNIRLDNKRQPETLKFYLSDNEYKNYLEETSSRDDIRSENCSFLHGYASTRSYK